MLRFGKIEELIEFDVSHIYPIDSIPYFDLLTPSF